MTRRAVPVTIVVPDASPLLTLGRVDRLDVLDAFTVPIHVVDVVAEEAQRSTNDRNGAVARWLIRRGNSIEIVSTNVGLGLAHRRAKGEIPATGNLGEIAVDEYATVLAKQGNPNLLPLVLFEDPDVLELRIARLAHVHLMNTAALLRNLGALGVIPDAGDILARINGLRTSPLNPIDRPARSTKITSTLRSAVRPREE